MAERIVVGILAHVDAGKTTLSEALLYTAGARRTLGRVDHGDAFLDTDALERERGITIFSKQALFSADGKEFTLLDTPGHVDFSAETERTLDVLDAAILVISGADGPQSHTRTLWRLLERRGVPVFLFVNKMDLPGADRESLTARLADAFGGGIVDFSSADRGENIAMCSEDALEEYLRDGAVSDARIAALIQERKLFPCRFGAALRLEGVSEFLDILARYTRPAPDSGVFGARVYKIGRDEQGTRLTWLRVTGGVLRVRDAITYTADGAAVTEKCSQLRLYSGAKYRAIDHALAGMVVAAAGFAHTFAGQALGAADAAEKPALEPVLTYRMRFPNGEDPFAVLPKLRELAEEDPMLRLVWDEPLREIQVQLMGQVQLEILQRRIEDRFGLETAFDAGRVVYRETIAAPVIGMGHFEPLRHYAEVHLLLEPGPRGSGLRIASACPTDELALSWQRLILSHLLERAHPGVLTGSPITDLRITLLAGRAHLKHTEGGDFRQATFRALRQGLMRAETVLLEPYYDFRLELPPECAGRAMNDIQEMGGTAEPPLRVGDSAVLTGCAPVAGLRGYTAVLRAYTRGRGRLSCVVRGYEPCRDAEAVAAAIGYDPERDAANPASSVFCRHGSGVIVPWDQAPAWMHLAHGAPRAEEAPEAAPERAAPRRTGRAEEDEELRRIFERTYGPTERKAFEPPRPPRRRPLDDEKYSVPIRTEGAEYLLVDGYNIIFAWDDLSRLARQDIAAARAALTEILSNYQGYRKCVVILVFDAYKVKGNPGSVEVVDGVRVVYTKEAQTADAYIERATYELRRERRVRVATSDNVEQLIILGHGAMRISAAAFLREVEEAEGEIAALIERHNAKNRRDNTLRRIATFRGE